MNPMFQEAGGATHTIDRMAAAKMAHVSSLHGAANINRPVVQLIKFRGEDGFLNALVLSRARAR